MRKFALIIAAVLLLILPVGCGGDPAPGFTKNDTYLTINGTEYRCHEVIDTVIASMGEEYQYAEGRSCDYDGLDKIFGYPVAEFYTWPLDAGDTVNEIYTESNLVTTSRGLTVGASREDVLAAYGDKCLDVSDQLIYQIEGDGLYLTFDLEGGIVKAISLSASAI